MDDARHITNSHRDTWRTKRILREAYAQWYRRMLTDLRSNGLPTLELGCGSGNLREFLPDAISTDIVFLDWADATCDAHWLPFKQGRIGNIVLVDVLHHLANPLRFLEQASDVLAPGGRILMVEPFPSPLSLFIYRRFHPEPFDMGTDYFAMKGIVRKEAWNSNQAIAYLLFYRHGRRWQKQFKGRLRLSWRRTMSTALYPASGGFEHRALVPDALIGALKVVEWLLTPLNRLLGFRCYVVLDKCKSERQ